MTTTQSDAQKSQLFKSLANIFVLFAVFGVVAGLAHGFSILSDGFTGIRLADALFNILIGVLAFICSRLLAKGNRLVILLHGGIVIASIVYAFAVGRGFDLIFTAIGVVILGALVLLWRRGELA